MGVFDDKKFDQLDWMSQMTETIESDINRVLAVLPVQMAVTYPIVAEQVRSSRGELSVRDLVRDLIRQHSDAIDSSLSWEEETKITECFKLEASDDLELDLVRGTLRGTITLIKTISTLEDGDLQKIMGAKGVNSIRLMELGTSDEVKLRTNEILDILGGGKEVQEAMRTKSMKKKGRALRDRLLSIFQNNEWRIRDTELANKISYWCRNYIKDGKLADLTNLCKVKVMTHNNMPIYSIEEEK